MKNCTCLSWQHCGGGRQVDQNLLTSQPSWTASRGRKTPKSCSDSFRLVHGHTKVLYTLVHVPHSMYVCMRIYIYAHTKNTSLGQTRVVSYDYCNLSTLDAEAGDPHIRGQQWCIEVCTYLNRKDWSNLKIKRMLRSMQQNKNISMQMFKLEPWLIVWDRIQMGKKSKEMH